MTLDGLAWGVSATLVTIVMLGILVLVHEAGHFVTARLAGIRVLEFGVGFPPRAKVLHDDGETIYTVNYLPIGGFVKLEGEDADSDDPRAFSNAPLRKQLVVLVAGVTMNLLTAVLVFFVVAWLAHPVVGVEAARIVPGSAAAQAGLTGGETIDSVNGQQFGPMSDQNILEAIAAHAGEKVQIGYFDKSGVHHVAPVTLGTDRAAGILGIRTACDTCFFQVKPTGTYAQTDPITAGKMAVGQTERALTLILGALGDIGHQIVTNPTQGPPGVAGPVGITEQVGVVLWGYGPVMLLFLAGILSANLALVNVLPFPPLDGGRMAVLVAKKIAGKRGVSAIEATSYVVGFALLIAFVLWITIFDIGRPISQ